MIASKKAVAAVVAAGVVGAAVIGTLVNRPSAVVAPAVATVYPLGVLADNGLTPGATNPAVTPATIATTIAVSGWTKTVRPPVSYTDKIKRDEIAARYPSPTYDERALELDHRIPLTTGGNPTDRRNLWIEPWSVPFGQYDLGARAKDHLEVRVNRLIVSGKLSLAEGQAIFTGDWPAAYHRYIGEWPKLGAVKGEVSQ